MKEKSSTTVKENGFDNPYQYTRAIRFKVKPQSQSQCFQKKLQELQINELQSDISELSDNLLILHTHLKKLFFYFNKKSEKLEFTKKLLVHKNWLQVWHKNVFHSSIKNGENKQGKYKLQDLEVLSLEIWLDDWKKKADQLKKYSQRPKEFQTCHSNIADLIRWFLNRQRVSYIQDFLNEAHTPEPNLDHQIKDLKNDLEKLQKDLKKAEQDYLSSDSPGIEVAKASFNYYTVNKNPKEYYNNELDKIKRKKDEVYFSMITQYKNERIMFIYKKNEMIKNKEDVLNVLEKLNELIKNQEEKTKKEIKNQVLTFRSDQEKEWLRRYLCKYKIKDDLQNGIEFSLEKTYHFIKTFKAEQKSVFDEVMKHIASNKKSGSSYTVKKENHLLKDYVFDYKNLNQENLNEIFLLFEFNKNRNEYNKFIDLTKNIQDDGNSEKRGKFFQYSFKEYRSLCDQYKNVAQKRGELIAQIKGIEKEKEEAKQTSYWSLIYVENDHKKLWLIPKNKIQHAKKDINALTEQNNSLECPYLCCFESLTMRALHKLCFAEQSSFVEAMPDDLKQFQIKIKAINKENNQGQSQTPEQKRERKKKEEVKFFKKVLEWQQELPDHDRRKTLQLKHFNLQTIHQTENFEKFEKALESACYYVKKISLNEDKKENLIKDHDVTVLDITSYDLEGCNKNTYQIPNAVSENKYHTDLWQVFWNNLNVVDEEVSVKGFKVGEVRLNPEVKIRYRKTDDALKKYLNNKGFPTKFKHRKKQEQLTIGLTLALNAGNKYEDLAFSKPEDLCEKINGFNAKLNSERNFKTTWKYGIDRGQIELATLCLSKFDPNQTYKVNGKPIPKPEFAQIECYRLTDYNYQIPFNDGKKRDKDKTHRKAIDNLSYFIDDESLFDIKPTSCLDLTTAKVIKGKIVTNGDVRTYLKLKKVSAKRKLYELYSKGQIDSTAKLEWEKYKFEYKNGKESKQHHPEGVLNIKFREKKDKDNKIKKEETIYEYCTEYKDILSEETIKQNLDCYLKKLIEKQDESHTPSILQINHLCKAIAGNMVGVISHLYKTYKGFVVFEDLWKEHKDFYYDAGVARDLEVALYNKFQSLSLVPPHVKDIIQLREDVRKQQNNKGSMKSSQIGAIVFVDEFDTSKKCPCCEEKCTITNANDMKYIQKRFICQSCGFDTYAFKTEEERVKDYTQVVKQESYDEKFQFLKGIDDPDKVAAYNIAKKITDSKNIGRWELPKAQSQEDQNKAHSKRHQNGQGKHGGDKQKNNHHKKERKNNKVISLKDRRKSNTSNKLTNKPFANLQEMMVKKK